MSGNAKAGSGEPTFGGWMGSMWLYTLLRIALFVILWGLVELIGVHGLVALLLAAALSIPLSFVLLSVPRARFAAKIEQRINARRADRAALDVELDPEPHDD